MGMLKLTTTAFHKAEVFTALVGPNEVLSDIFMQLH